MLSLLLLAAAAHAPARAADPVIGTWMNRRETVAVATRRCGRSLCGRVVWAAPEAAEKARAGGTDRLVGTELLRGLEPVGPGAWSGEVFVPDLGTSADADLTLIDRATLEINGCRLAGLMCKRQTWHKVRALPRRR